MVEEGYSNQEIENISGASSSAVSRWKQQYQAEKQGITPTHKKAITPEHMRIQDLEKQWARAKMDIDILKKASALFIGDNQNKGWLKRWTKRILNTGFLTYAVRSACP